MPALLSLRDVAKRLAIAEHAKHSIADRRLLDLLKSGALIAKVRMPAESAIEWIEVPTSYWMTVTVGDFSSVRLSLSNHKRVGTYHIHLFRLRDEYLNLVRNRTGDKSINVTDEVAAAVKAGSTPLEPMIFEEDWAKFLDAANLTGNNVIRGPGRPPSKNWRDTSIVMAAYFWELGSKGISDDKHEVTAKAIWDIASKQYVGVPEWATLKEQIRKSFELINKRAIKIDPKSK
jgi:hypothetical protein